MNVLDGGKNSKTNKLLLLKM